MRQFTEIEEWLIDMFAAELCDHRSRDFIFSVGLAEPIHVFDGKIDLDSGRPLGPDPLIKIKPERRESGVTQP